MSFVNMQYAVQIFKTLFHSGIPYSFSRSLTEDPAVETKLREIRPCIIKFVERVDLWYFTNTCQKHIVLRE